MLLAYRRSDYSSVTETISLSLPAPDSAQVSATPCFPMLAWVGLWTWKAPLLWTWAARTRGETPGTRHRVSPTARLYVDASAHLQTCVDHQTWWLVIFIVFLCWSEGSPVRGPAQWQLYGGHGQSGAAGSQFWRLWLPVTRNRRYVWVRLICSKVNQDELDPAWTRERCFCGETGNILHVSTHHLVFALLHLTFSGWFILADALLLN